MSACCGAARERKAIPKRAGKVRGIFSWVLPSAVLVLMPKCPACLAAYVMLGTGLGLSFSTARYMRWGLLGLCITTLLFLILKRFGYFKKEIDPCNTK